MSNNKFWNNPQYRAEVIREQAAKKAYNLGIAAQVCAGSMRIIEVYAGLCANTEVLSLLRNRWSLFSAVSKKIERAKQSTRGVTKNLSYAELNFVLDAIRIAAPCHIRQEEKDSCIKFFTGCLKESKRQTTMQANKLAKEQKQLEKIVVSEVHEFSEDADASLTFEPCFCDCSEIDLMEDDIIENDLI